MTSNQTIKPTLTPIVTMYGATDAPYATTQDLHKLAVPNAHCLIAYHANCIDGFTSAWITAKAMEYLRIPYVLLPMSYTEDSREELVGMLDLANFTLLMVVDFSLPMETLQYIAAEQLVDKTIILDHHKTAFEAYSPGIAVTKYSHFMQQLGVGSDEAKLAIILANNECGATICAEFFAPILPGYLLKEIATINRYVRDYDLWLFEFGEATKAFNLYLEAQDKVVGKWSKVAFDMYNHYGIILNLGLGLLTEHRQLVSTYVAQARPVQLAGHDGLAVTCPSELTNDVGHELALACGTFGLLTSTTNPTKHSLRSNDDYDVIAIARAFGGGGHKNAAGFTYDFTSAVTFPMNAKVV